MRISQVGAGARFVEAANFLNIQIELSQDHGSRNGRPDNAPYPPFIRRDDRQEIHEITAQAGIARTRAPDQMSSAELDELFAPFLERLEPFISKYDLN